MSENMNELHELDELKAAYNLMDLRLDDQKIVSDEQLREAMYRKFADIRQNAKEGLIWANVIFVPILAWWAWANNDLTILGIVLLGVYWLASLVYRFVVLRRTKKEDYGGYDLKTLVEKESRYTRDIKWGGIVTVVFLMVFFLQIFAGKEGSEFMIFMIMLIGLMVVLTVRRKKETTYKYKGQVLDSVTGKPRVSDKKWVIVLYGLSACLMLFILVMTIANSTGWLGLLRVVNILATFIAIAVLLLGSFHQKGKINVSRRLLIILAVVAIALSVLVTGIAAMMDFTELTRSTNLLITAAFSAMGLSFHRMKK